MCTPILRSKRDHERSVMDRFVGQFATNPLVSASSFCAYESVLNDCRPSQDQRCGLPERLILSSVYLMDCNANVVRYQVMMLIRNTWRAWVGYR